MKEENYKVQICLDDGKEISLNGDFEDYIRLMYNLKTRTFIAYGIYTINKMHIVHLKTNISPSIIASVNRFIHEQKEDAFDLGMKREQLYSRWCESLPIKREYSTNLSSLNVEQNGTR